MTRMLPKCFLSHQNGCESLNTPNVLSWPDPAWHFYNITGCCYNVPHLRPTSKKWCAGNTGILPHVESNPNVWIPGIKIFCSQESRHLIYHLKQNSWWKKCFFWKSQTEIQGQNTSTEQGLALLWPKASQKGVVEHCHLLFRLRSFILFFNILGPALLCLLAATSHKHPRNALASFSFLPVVWPFLC